MTQIPLSALEITTVQRDGLGLADILGGTLAVARRVEELGYRRVWYPEHHSSPTVTDFPPAVMIAHVAAATSTIRVGAGGVLAPNHVPLSLSEQFGTLAALHQGRVDMGIGRGPGTMDQAAARALRRGAERATDEEYRADVTAVLHQVASRSDVPEPWLLASSSAGASLAASLGLPLAFAYHIAPANAAQAIERYREDFTPSHWSETPMVMVSVQTVCAETDEAAAALARAFWIWKTAAHAEGVDIPQLDPETAAEHVFSTQHQDVLDRLLPHVAEGSPETVSSRLAEVASRFDVDEFILTTPVQDPKSRMRSFELAMRAHADSRSRHE